MKKPFVITENCRVDRITEKYGNGQNGCDPLTRHDGSTMDEDLPRPVCVCEYKNKVEKN